MAPDPHEVAAVFGRAAASYDQVIPFFAHFGRVLVDHAGLRPGEAVLDVGTGRGAALRPAAERVGPSGRALGVDLAPEMIARLDRDIAAWGLPQAGARLMDAQALDLPDASFDCVVSNFVLQLLPSPEAAAAEIRRVLVEGGRGAVSVPVASGPSWAFLRELFGTYASRATRPVPLAFRPDFDPVPALAGAGLAVTDDHTVDAEFHLDGPEQWWRWAWSHGMRAVFEVLDPADLEELRAEVTSRLAGRDAVVVEQSARLVVARAA